MFKEEFVFVRILIPLLVGIGIFYFVESKNITYFIGALLVVSFLFILSINTYYKQLNAFKFKGLIGIVIYLLFFLLGSFLSLINNERLKPNYFNKKKVQYLKVWVNDEVMQTNGILRFKTRVVSGYVNKTQIALSGQLLLAIKPDPMRPVKIAYGDELIIPANYLSVEPPYNPGEFDFRSWLSVQNIYEQTFLKQIQLIKTGRNIGNPFVKFALKLRGKQVAKYKKIIKNEEAFAVASTLILGYRADLSKETLSAYSKTGTIHALSVSGSHVAIIFFVLDLLLLFMDRNKMLSILKIIIICCLLWTYALITGLSPSVVRSAIMITIFIVAKTFAKNKNGYNTLAFAAFCQLTYNPFLIWDVGFQLSYLSVVGLIYLQPKIYKWVYLKNKWLNKVWELTALSIAAQVVTFPLSIYYFHQFPVYFLLGNLFISLPLIMIMILGIGVLIPYVDRLSPILEYIIVFTNRVLNGIANLPYSTVSSVWINLPELLMLSISLLLFVYALVKYNKRMLVASLFLLISYQLIVVYNNWQAINQKKIIFFSLRKNYAAAFISSTETIVVTDLNDQDKTFQFFIKPALDQSQINKVKTISLKKDTIASHFILHDGQIIFDEYKILIISELWNNKKVTAHGKFNSLWLTGNTRFKLQTIPKEIEYQNIIIDATNKDYKIEWLKKFSQNSKIPIRVLKKNPAYLVQLTESYGKPGFIQRK